MKKQVEWNFLLFEKVLLVLVGISQLKVHFFVISQALMTCFLCVLINF